MSKYLTAALMLVLTAGAGAEWNGTEFRQQQVTLVTNTCTVREAAWAILGNPDLAVGPQSYSISGPQEFQQAQVDPMIIDQPLDTALDTIIRLGGSKYEVNYDGDGQVKLELSPSAKQELDAKLDAWMRQEWGLREHIAAALSNATAVTVYLLDPDLENGPGETFPIVPYETRTRILKTEALQGADRNEFLRTLAETLRVKENTFGALCHHPIHGVEVQGAEGVIFRSSFCWRCRNYYVEFPMGGATWVSVPETGIQAIFERLLPIPQDIIDRFSGSSSATPAQAE